MGWVNKNLNYRNYTNPRKEGGKEEGGEAYPWETYHKRNMKETYFRQGKEERRRILLAISIFIAFMRSVDL